MNRIASLSALASALFTVSGVVAVAALEPGEPSRTAIEAGAARAIGSHDPDPFTRNPDWLAAPLLGVSELTLISSHPINRSVDQDPRISVQDPDVLPLVRLNTVRTRFIDDALQRQVRGGATQLVIVGAGFDTRAYRFRALLERVKVFEVDSAATQDLKKSRIHDIFGAAPPNVVYVPIDWSHDRLAAVLRRSGFDPMAKSMFIWEGGSMYQPESVVRGVLRDIGQGAPGTSLVMDFDFEEARRRAANDPASTQKRFDGAWGEPWLFGIPDAPGAEAFFRELGLKPVEILPADSPTAVRRYLTHRDQTIVGQGLEVHDSVPLTLVELVVERN